MLYRLWGHRASIEQRSDHVVEGFSQMADKADLGGYRVTMQRHCMFFVRLTKFGIALGGEGIMRRCSPVRRCWVLVTWICISGVHERKRTDDGRFWVHGLERRFCWSGAIDTQSTIDMQRHGLPHCYGSVLLR